MAQNTSLRFDRNPFLDELVIIKGSKQVRVSKDEEHDIVLTPSTGLVSATHVVTYKTVDKEQFIKKFMIGMTATFDLNKAGNKALHVLYWVMQREAKSTDSVRLNKYAYEDFQAFYAFKAFSMSVFERGLVELEKAKIIAKSTRRGEYFINPAIAWNGDRIAFSQAYQVKGSGLPPREGDQHKQQEILESDAL